MAMFSCPVIPRSEIVKTLSDYQIINITESQFTNPTSNFLYDLYVALLRRLDFLMDDLTQVDFTALDQLENLDVHSDSISVMNLFSKIKQSLAAVQSPLIFTLGDLILPETQRTLKFVSVFLNFLMHKESVINDLTEVMGNYDVLDKQRSEYEAKISQVNAEMSVCTDAREKDTPHVQELEAKVKDLDITVRKLNNEQSSLRATSRKMRDKVEEMNKEIKTAEFELLQSAQENASLQSKFVHSPDKLQSALEEKKALCDETKKLEKSAMKDFEDKSATYDVHLKASKKMSKHFDQMQALQDQVTSAKSIEKNVKQLKSKLADEQLQESSLKARLVELQGTDQQLNESKKEVEKEKAQKCEAYLRKLNTLKLEVESRKQDLEKIEKKIEAVLAEVDTVKLEISSCKKYGEETQQALLMKGEMLVIELNKYWKSIEGPLEKIEAGDIC